jgi:hypothetical protein
MQQLGQKTGRRPMSVKRLCLLAVAFLIACSSASGGSGPSSSAAPRRTDILTTEQIVEAHADLVSAYDAVARLRPNWLIRHGSDFATVFVDGQQYGTVASLRNIQAFQIARARYYDPTQAGGVYGVKGGTGGVIEVTTK